MGVGIMENIMRMTREKAVERVLATDEPGMWDAEWASDVADMLMAV